MGVLELVLDRAQTTCRLLAADYLQTAADYRSAAQYIYLLYRHYRHYR